MTLILSILLQTGLAAEATVIDKLVILSPHRKTIQTEFMPVFKDYYKNRFATEVDVEWIDQSATSNAIKSLAGKKFSPIQKMSVLICFGTAPFLTLLKWLR